MTRDWRPAGGVVLAIVLLLAAALYSPRKMTASYSQFTRELRQGNIESVAISGRHAAAVLRKGAPLETILPDDTRDVIAGLESAGAEIRFDDSMAWQKVVLNTTPFLLLLSLWLVLLYHTRGRPQRGLPFI